MQALGAEQRGVYSDVLQYHHLPETKDPQAHDVRIKVAYSDLNPVDLQKLANGPPIDSDSIFVPGYGGSGIIEHVGSAAPKTLLGKQVCFLADPGRRGSYASHVMVDHRCVAEIPSSKGTVELHLRDAACIPVAGLTAYECLVKLGLASDKKIQAGQVEDVGLSSSAKENQQQQSTDQASDKSLLIVGASGGVGSWILTLAKAWHPNMKLIATTGSPQSEEYCKTLGATKCIKHHEIDQALKDGKDGSVDLIVSLTEPTPALFQKLSEVVKPYGKIVLVVAGKGIESLNMGFCFFKCVNVYTETVFSSIRTHYKHIIPRDEMLVIINLMATQRIKAPLSPTMTDGSVSEKFSDALKDNGVLKLLAANSKRGNLVMMVYAGDGLILMDLKTASIFSIPRKACIKKKVLTQSKKNENEWQEQAQIVERQELIKKLTAHPKLGITKVAEKQVSDYQDGIDMQEAEAVKNMWGVQLKKREKNAKGEELIFVDLRTGAMGELARKKCIELGALTLGKNDEGQEVLEEAVTDFAERDDLVVTVRQALKINLES